MRMPAMSKPKAMFVIMAAIAVIALAGILWVELG